MEVIGNESFIELIYRLRNHRPYPHTLLYGPSGVGKTTIARYISKILELPVKQLPTTDLQGYYIHLALQALKPYTVLLMDEIHTLKDSVAEALYEPMDSFTYFGKPVPTFSLIGMTTEPHKLLSPFIRRFQIAHRLDWYTTDQIMGIVRLVKTKEWTDDAIISTSLLARGTPGLVCNFVTVIEGISVNGIIDIELVYDFCRMQGLDALGLHSQDRKYLQCLRYGRLGIATISSLMGEPEKGIEQQIEPFLFRLGLVVKEARGRRLTTKGLEYIEENQE